MDNYLPNLRLKVKSRLRSALKQSYQESLILVVDEKLIIWKLKEDKASYTELQIVLWALKQQISKLVTK